MNNKNNHDQDSLIDEHGHEHEQEQDSVIDEFDFDEMPPAKIPVFYRIVALITVLAFLGLIGISAWPRFSQPVADLISGSYQLKKEIDSQLLQAVVEIEVVARKPGSLLAIEQKKGTGFNIDPAGAIITNHHVIDGAQSITIKFPDGKMYPAAAWTSKPEYDLAPITLEEVELPVVPLNTTSQPFPGEPIRVVGNPLGLKNIAVEGKVDQYLKLKDKPELVFSIDAPIYQGNSGSPVFNKNGEVVGVVFATLHRPGEDSDRIIGLAIPVQEILHWQQTYN